MKIQTRKRYGQHFLHDKNVINRIIDNIGNTDDCTLIEIGPGRGAITFPLLKITDRLHVIEIDKDLAALLEPSEEFSDKLTVHQEDALKIDFCTRFNGKLSIIGNLPYNISTPLLFHLLENRTCINQMVLMLQKEVAERICAEPGNKDYGRLTVMVQSVCEVQPLFNVSPESFTPQPKVESTVIKLMPADNIHTTPVCLDDFKLIVRTAFSKRRKTLRNALKGLIEEQDMVSLGIDPTSRPEVISVESYVKLANCLQIK